MNTYLVQFETADGHTRMIEVEAPELHYAGGVAVEKVTGMKLNWAMKTGGGAIKPDSRLQRLLARFFLRYS